MLADVTKLGVHGGHRTVMALCPHSGLGRKLPVQAEVCLRRPFGSTPQPLGPERPLVGGRSSNRLLLRGEPCAYAQVLGEGEGKWPFVLGTFLSNGKEKLLYSSKKKRNGFDWRVLLIFALYLD